MSATRADRIATAQKLRDALHRMSAPGPSDGSTPDPIGNCGRDATESCGMIDPAECRTHADPPDGDPATLSYSGTLRQRRQQLKAARRRGLRF
jgi:hypothetical protein